MLQKGKYQVDDLVTKLSFVSGTYLVDFLQSIGLTLPRKLRMNVLFKVLKEPVERTIEERKSLADEMGYRLTWFSKFTDTQLVNLLEWYKSTSLGNLYLTGFWRDFLDYIVVKGVSDSDIDRLFTEADNAIKTNKRPLTLDFNKALNAVLYDENGEIDGVTQAQFRPVTYKATTLTELRGIGEKYNAPIPKRLKKNEMLQVILDKLKERNELTPELEKKLKTQNIILLERFAKDHNIKVSTELKKEEIIEFILSNAEETKSTYFVPQSQEVYENLDEPVVKKEAPKPEVKIEPVVEPKPVNIEKVIEPTMTPNVVVNADVIDYRPQLDKLTEAFNRLAESFKDKEFSVNIENSIKPESVVVQEPVIKEEQVVRPQPTNMMVNQEALIQELLREDDSDAPELDPEKPFDIDGKIITKEFKYKRGFGVFAALLSLVFAALFTWVFLLSFGLLVAPFFVKANQMVNDLDATMKLVVNYGSIVLALINIYAFIILLRKPSKQSLKVLGFITLFTGFIITGLFVFASIGTKVQVIEQKEETETTKLAEAIEKISHPDHMRKVKKSRGFMFGIFVFLTFVLLVFAMFYGIWRLEFTYGYENIRFIGPFLRDYIIEPLFGSAHDMSQYYV
nr:hypothetical protein QOL21_05355 [Acholeplasma laidlawii]